DWKFISIILKAIVDQEKIIKSTDSVVKFKVILQKLINYSANHPENNKKLAIILKRYEELKSSKKDLSEINNLLIETIDNPVDTTTLYGDADWESVKAAAIAVLDDGSSAHKFKMEHFGELEGKEVLNHFKEWLEGAIDHHKSNPEIKLKLEILLKRLTLDPTEDPSILYVSIKQLTTMDDDFVIMNIDWSNFKIILTSAFSYNPDDSDDANTVIDKIITWLNKLEKSPSDDPDISLTPGRIWVRHGTSLRIPRTHT
ncbi:unnamed protein product, partial [Meganyctiphanes norvegica]